MVHTLHVKGSACAKSIYCCFHTNKNNNKKSQIVPQNEILQEQDQLIATIEENLIEEGKGSPQTIWGNLLSCTVD